VGRRVAVVGAGAAGLAAAATLAERGQPVTVFEASRNLGGRARCVTLDGVDLDNGQHILIGLRRDAPADAAGRRRSRAPARAAAAQLRYARFRLRHRRCPRRCTSSPGWSSRPG
jgi:phytoene dehydrogenase-like protein